VLYLQENKSSEILEVILRDFADRHQGLENTFLRNLKKIEELYWCTIDGFKQSFQNYWKNKRASDYAQ
jgi:hypothetical protein